MFAHRLSFLLAVATCLGLAGVTQAADRVVTRGDVHLALIDQGAGPAIVMVPSLGRGAHDFDDLAGRLVAAGFRVIRPQPRGIGESTGPMTGLTLHDLADDVALAITGSGLSSAVVLGHDDGNRIARATAAFHPERVSRVILVGAGGKVPPDPEAAAALRGVFDTTLSPDAHLHAVDVGFFAPGNDPSVWRDGWHADVAKMEAAAGAATPLKDWWTAGSAPLLVVVGNQDRIAPPANADRLKADVGDRAVVVRLDGAGHALLPEQPKALADAIIAYLRSPPPSL
jgi:pimeloyl-ACP methyl ester carboxylesterase